MAQGRCKKISLLKRLIFAHQISKIRAVKAGDVFIGLAKLELRQNVVTNVARGAGRERGNGMIGKMRAQAAQLPVFGAEFVSPLGDAMSFVDGKKGDRNFLQPADGISASDAFGRQIKQAVCAVTGL